MQTIQMQLSQKQKTISQLICAFFRIYIKFWTFSKNHDSHSFCISRNYGHRKSWLDKCPKSSDSEDPSKGNVVNGRNIDLISTAAPLSSSLLTVMVMDLEKVSVSDMENLKTVC